MLGRYTSLWTSLSLSKALVKSISTSVLSRSVKMMSTTAPSPDNKAIDSLAEETTALSTQTQSSPLKSTLITPLPGTPLSMEINKTATFSGLTRPDLDNYCPASNLAFNEKIKRWQEAGETVYHFGFGQSPFPVIECMVRALREHAGENAYLPVTGIANLRESICELHRRYDNMTGLHQDQIAVGPGSKELIFLLLSVFNGDVLVVSPSWTTYKPQAQLANKRAFTVDTKFEDNWRITPEALEKTILDNKITGNKILILCNPDNPTGTSYTDSHLAQLSETLRKHNVIVLSDEIYGRLHYTNQHCSLSKYYPEGTIVSSGFSKWASAGGWRVGYHIYPPELKALKEAVKSAASHSYSCAPAPMQHAVAKGLSNMEECERYISHTSRIMSHISLFVHSELTSIGIKAVKPTAGYYMFPNFELLRDAFSKRGILTCEQMCAAMLEEAKVALMAGGPAFLRPVNEFTVRLCFVNFDGKSALEESYKMGLDEPLPDTFVESYAKPVYDGIKAIQTWCLNLLNQQETN